MFDGIKDKFMGFADTILDLPMKVKHPRGRKLATMGLCLAIIGVSAVVFVVSMRMVGLDTINNPNPLKLMGLVLPIGLGGGSLAIFLHFAIPKKHHKTAKTVMALAAVIFLVGAGAAFIKFSLLNSYPDITSNLANPWVFIGGTTAAAGGFYALGHAIPLPRHRTHIVTADDEEIQDMKNKRDYQDYLQKKNQPPAPPLNS